MPKKTAFSLIEILIVLALLSVFLTVSLFFILRSKVNQELNFAAQSLADKLREAHIFSREFKEEKVWGIQSSSNNSFSLVNKSLSGSVETTQTIEMPSSVAFADTFAIWFNKGSGHTSAFYNIRLNSQNGTSKNISVSNLSVIEIQNL